MNISCIGDSNTYGFDPYSPMGGRYSHTIRWTGRLEAAGHRVTNLGANGLPAGRLSIHAVLARELQAEGPFDLVMVMLGANDILLGASVEETAEALEALTETLKTALAAAQETRLLLIAPPPFIPGFWVESMEQIIRSQELAAACKALAEQQHILFADAGQWGIPLACDGVHFTEEGHRIFAEKLLEIIRTVS